MPSGQSKSCCTSCCSTLLSIGFSLLVTFIVYRATTKGPRLYLSHIQGTGPGDNASSALTCQIETKNRARFLGIYYDDLLVSVAYPPGGPNVSATIPAFYQGFHKRDFKEAALLAAPWIAAKAAAAAGNVSVVPIRVEVDTKFRYKALIIWKSKRYGLNVSEDVQVTAEGRLTAPDHVLLKSAALRGIGIGSTTTGWPAGTMVVFALLSWI